MGTILDRVLMVYTILDGVFTTDHIARSRGAELRTAMITSGWRGHIPGGLAWRRRRLVVRDG